jgi:SAM-dependent methyltransferase
MDWVGALSSPLGQRLLREAMRSDLSPERSFQLGEALRARYPAELVAPALTLAELRIRARAKFSRADRMWFTREGLEQASSELTAGHRALRCGAAAVVADLCSGVGGDLVALARRGQVRAVDLDPLHLEMAGLNSQVYGVAGNVRLEHGDAREVSLDGVDLVYVDPARRQGGRRLRPGVSHPSLAWCLGLVDRVAAVVVKAAPGLPTGIVPRGWELEFVAEGRDLKEAVLWSPALATTERRATLLPEELTLGSAPGPAVPSAAPGAYVVDPGPAVTRAGLVEELARSLGAWKLDDQHAFISSDAPVRTPFGRTLRVEASLPWNLKRLRARLRQLGVGAVDIRKRGSPLDVERLRRQLDLDGDRRMTVLLTRVLGRPWVLLCEDA